MTVSTRFFNTVLLALFVLMSMAPVAFAHSTEVNFLPTNLTSWKTYGSPWVSSSQVTLQGSDKEWAYVDIDADHVDEAYIVLATYVDKDDSRSNMSSSDKSRSGNPYLYAYYFDKDGKIQKYLSGTDVMSTTRSGSDQVVYGTFPTVSGTETIRVFLKQSSVKNLSNSGVNVTFVQPILLEANSLSEARGLVQDFARLNLSYR
ncbi:hypothetical protein EPN81_01740 [Patescibacteria group bacterium]|nr:MAG: hypothetical protein EPN81_01740 [Patescibacteria group bacterium]